VDGARRRAGLVWRVGFCLGQAARRLLLTGNASSCSLDRFYPPALCFLQPVRRAIDDKTARELLGTHFRRQLLLDGRVGTVAVVATATDDLDALEVAAALDVNRVVPYSGISAQRPPPPSPPCGASGPPIRLPHTERRLQLMDLDDDTLGLVAGAASMAPYGGGLLATCRRARAVDMAALSRAVLSSCDTRSAGLSHFTLKAAGGSSTRRVWWRAPYSDCPSEHRLVRTLAFLRQPRGLKVVDLRDYKEGCMLSDEDGEKWLAAWGAVGTGLGHSRPALTNLSVSGMAMAALGGLLGDAVAGRPATDLKRRRLNTGGCRVVATQRLRRRPRRFKNGPTRWRREPGTPSGSTRPSAA